MSLYREIEPHERGMFAVGDGHRVYWEACGKPLVTSCRLAGHWPGSELVIVDNAGHDAGHPGIADHIVAATGRFADRRD